MSIDEYRQYVKGLSAEDKVKLEFMVGLEMRAQRDVRRLEQLRNWEPRPYQANLWNYLEGGGTRAVAIWHRRSGKDDVVLNWTARAAHESVGEYWHMLPESGQARKAIWDAVNPHTGVRRIDQAFPRELRDKTRENDMAIVFKNGSLWRVVGSDNYNSLVGSTPKGVVFSEWALADPNAWAFLRPILVENGGWAVFITTTRGPNHARKTYELGKQESGWFAEILPAKDTGVFTEEQLQTELREYQHDYGIEEGAALFEQEYNCSFESALVGSYYGASLTRMQQSGRIGKVPIDRSVLVHTAWDLGVSDSTAIWFVQCVGKERRFVDYHEASGVGLDEYIRVLHKKREEQGWIYGTHYFPHDIAVKELSSGMSRVDTLRGLGVKANIVPASNVNDGINAVRRTFDSAWIDEVRCSRGLDALRNYRRAWNEKTKMFSDAPLHDWTSHGADAARTFATGYRDPKEKPPIEAAKLPSFFGMGVDRGTGWMGT